MAARVPAAPSAGTQLTVSIMAELSEITRMSRTLWQVVFPQAGASLVHLARFSCAFVRVLPGASKSGPYGCAYAPKRN